MAEPQHVEVSMIEKRLFNVYMRGGFINIKLEGVNHHTTLTG